MMSKVEIVNHGNLVSQDLLESFLYNTRFCMVFIIKQQIDFTDGDEMVLLNVFNETINV